MPDQASIYVFCDVIGASTYLNLHDTKKRRMGDAVVNVIPRGNEDVCPMCLQTSYYFEYGVPVDFGTFIQCINEDEDFGKLSCQDTKRCNIITTNSQIDENIAVALSSCKEMISIS